MIFGILLLILLLFSTSSLFNILLDEYVLVFESMRKRLKLVAHEWPNKRTEVLIFSIRFKIREEISSYKLRISDLIADIFFLCSKQLFELVNVLNVNYNNDKFK